jgi:hypothetical protein
VDRDRIDGSREVRKRAATQCHESDGVRGIRISLFSKVGHDDSCVSSQVVPHPLTWMTERFARVAKKVRARVASRELSQSAPADRRLAETPS